MANEESEEKPAKGGSLGLVLVTAVLCLALGGGGAFFFLRQQAPAASEAAEESAEAAVEGEAQPDPGAC